MLRAVNDGHGELGHLLHAERVRAELAVSGFAQSHVEQRFVRTFHGGFGRQPGKLRHHAHEANRRHAGDERVVLRHVADP